MLSVKRPAAASGGGGTRLSRNPRPAAQHGRRASPTADERLRSYEESRESYRSRFFLTRNNDGAVLPAGETRRSADFYVSADLTRPSERRLQAGKNRVFRHLSNCAFLYIFGLFLSCVLSRLTPSRRAWTHVPRGRARGMRQAGRWWPVERRDTCSAMAAYWRRRSLCAAWRHAPA